MVWISFPGRTGPSPNCQAPFGKRSMRRRPACPSPDFAPPPARKQDRLMRTLKFSLVFFGLFVSVPALAGDNNTDQAEDQPPQMKLGGADTRAPGPLTVPPAEIQLPPIGQTPTEDLQFDYHGYFRVPLAMSFGKRATPGPD